MKNRKRLLLIALMTAAAVSAFAQQYDPKSDFTVTKLDNDKSIEIIEYIGSKQTVNIPPIIQGLPVTSIGGMAFSNCTNLTNVMFQGTIASDKFNTFVPFPGDLRNKFYATDKDKGTPGTYTRASGSNTWTKQ